MGIFLKKSLLRVLQRDQSNEQEQACAPRSGPKTGCCCMSIKPTESQLHQSKSGNSITRAQGAMRMEQSVRDKDTKDGKKKVTKDRPNRMIPARNGFKTLPTCHQKSSPHVANMAVLLVGLKLWSSLRARRTGPQCTENGRMRLSRILTSCGVALCRWGAVRSHSYSMRTKNLSTWDELTSYSTNRSHGSITSTWHVPYGPSRSGWHMTINSVCFCCNLENASAMRLRAGRPAHAFRCQASRNRSRMLGFVSGFASDCDPHENWVSVSMSARGRFGLQTPT